MVLVPGVMNALAARIADDEGFEALYVTGAGLTNAFMGKPDVGLIDLTQIGLNLAMIRDVTELPLIVDADTGFGNAVNVYRTIRVLERAGASAVQIEDQEFPKRCGHFSGKDVIPTADMVAKIRAAADARRHAETVIIARTDALAVDGPRQPSIARPPIIEAGADVTFVEAPRSREQMQRVAALPVPQMANIVHGGKTPPLRRSELAEMGFSLVLYANAALQAAPCSACSRVLRRLKGDGVLEELSGVRHRLHRGAPAARRQAQIDALEKTYSTHLREAAMKSPGPTSSRSPTSSAYEKAGFGGASPLRQEAGAADHRRAVSHGRHHADAV